MITRATLSTIEQGLPKYRSMLAGNTAFVPVGFDSIATLTASGGETSMTFSGIPQTFKMLHLRTYARRNAAGGFAVSLRFNGDTGSTNYSSGYVEFSNSGLSYQGSSADAQVFGVRAPSSTNASNIFGAGIFEIDNYASTTQNKSVQYVGGFNANGVTTGTGTYGSSAWYNTSAITSITMFFRGDALAAGTTFSLYGVS